MSNILKHLFIYLSDIFGASDMVNYSIIQQFNISSMSDVLNHVIIYLSDIFGASDNVNYSIIQWFDISSMSNVLNHLIIYLSVIFGASDGDRQSPLKAHPSYTVAVELTPHQEAWIMTWLLMKKWRGRWNE